MTIKENGGPAFPEAGLSGLPNGEFLHGRSGMDLRDWFAGKAMQGYIVGAEHPNAKSISETAYKVADAMIVERAK